MSFLDQQESTSQSPLNYSKFMPHQYCNVENAKAALRGPRTDKKKTRAPKSLGWNPSPRKFCIFLQKQLVVNAYFDKN